MEEIITVGGGCFWCIEAVFSDLKGVSEAVSGYAGGELPYPTYDQVCAGRTGHAEVVQVSFDPEIISLHDLLTIFFTLHDPTTLDRQGADVGSQYRSIIFYRTPEQKEIIQQVIEEFSDNGTWEDPLVTKIEPFSVFYPAEEYHQHFFKQHPEQGYCQAVIAPKVTKLRQKFKEKLQA